MSSEAGKVEEKRGTPPTPSQNSDNIGEDQEDSVEALYD